MTSDAKPNILPTQIMQYAANGNIQQKYDAGAYTYGSKPHAVTQLNPVAGLENIITPYEDITYNVLGKATLITSNTSQDNLVSSRKELSLSYNPAGQRSKTEYFESNGLQKTTFFFGNYEKEINADGSMRELNYINTPEGLAGVYVTGTANTNGMHYVLTDHLGSWNYIIKPNGEVEEHSFDAWGRRRNPTNGACYTYAELQTQPQTFSRGYTGHEMLYPFGLINMNGRMYDAVLGRMLSPDNNLQDPTNSQNFNRYSYCLNDPITYNDPSGNDYFGVGNAGPNINVSHAYFDPQEPFASAYRPEYTMLNGKYPGCLTLFVYEGKNPIGIGTGYEWANNAVKPLNTSETVNFGGVFNRDGYGYGDYVRYNAGNRAVANIAARWTSFNDIVSGLLNNSIFLYDNSEFRLTCDFGGGNRYPGIYKGEISLLGGNGISLPPLATFTGNNPYEALSDHEHGHYLQYKQKGFFNYYKDVGIPSIYNTIENEFEKAVFGQIIFSVDHWYYRTETEANSLAKSHFGPNSAVAGWPQPNETKYKPYKWYQRLQIYKTLIFPF